MELEKTNTEVVTVEAEEVEEESPLLVAQRYLNIFRQIHIFKAAKKAEFDNELLNLPEKIKRILISLPGGSILLEHILELEEQNNYSTQLTKSILSQKKGKDAYDSPAEAGAQSLTPVSGEIKIGNDFAAVLAKSLAAAFGNAPLPQPIYNVPAVSTDGADGNKVATQTNVAASTVNNIHVDYSIFQNLADAINKSNTQTHNDFMKVIETLSQTFSPTIIPADGVPISAITSSIAQILKETTRLQLEEMKIFSQSLTEAILGGHNLKPSRNINMQQGSAPKFERTFNDFSADKKTSFNTTSEPKFTKDTNSETQTISVVNRTIDPLTSQSTVQKNSYSIPADTVSQNTFSSSKPQKKADPLKQAQSVLERISLNVKPVSLSIDEPENSFTQPKAEPKPQQSVTQLSENENNSLNMLQNAPAEETFGDEEEWEYVDEYGNPITDATGDEEWEYVDENGNPITDEGDGEWEYVDETELATTSEINENTAEAPQPVVQTTEDNKIEETKVTLPEENQPSGVEETKTEPDQKEKPTKAGGIFSSLFKKKSQTGEEAKASAEQKQEEEKTSADDVLAAAFSDKPEETSKDSENKIKKSSVDNLLMAAFSGKSAEAPREEPKKEETKDSADDILAAAFSDKPAETPKEEPQKEETKDSADDILAAAFGGKPAETPKEEPQKQETKDSADDILAAAFGGNNNEDQKENPKPKIGGILAEAYKEIEKEKKAISSKDMLAQLAKNKPQTTEELLNTAAPKKDNSADDILAAAFGGNKNEDSEEKPKPKMGGILAEAYKEIEISKKPLSSKDMLAEAFKSKPQTSAELLNSKASVEELTEDAKASADDILVAAFGDKPAETPKEEPQEQESKDSADDILAAAFGGQPAETSKEEPQEQEAKDSADDILAAAFGGQPAEIPKEEPQKEETKDSADDVLAAAFEIPKENKKHDPEFEALLKAFQS